MRVKSGTEFKRDEGSLHDVPAGVIISMPFVLLLMLAGFVGVAYFTWSRSYGWMIFCGCFVVGLAVYGSVVDNLFNFHSRCKCTFEDDCIKYTYHLNKSVIPSGTTEVTVRIFDLKGYRLIGHGAKAEFRGRVVKKQPLRNEVTLSKVTLPVDFTDREAFFEGIKKYMV